MKMTNPLINLNNTRIRRVAKAFWAESRFNGLRVREKVETVLSFLVGHHRAEARC